MLNIFSTHVYSSIALRTNLYFGSSSAGKSIIPCKFILTSKTTLELVSLRTLSLHNTPFGAHQKMANLCLRHHRCLYSSSFSCKHLTSICRSNSICRSISGHNQPQRAAPVSRGGCLGHFADLAYLTRASYGAMSLPGFVVPYYASIHTWGTLSMAPAEDKRDVKATKSKSNEHGSVLMEIIKSQDQQPKQLTVGSKVVQAGKDFTYLVVIVAGFAVAGFLFWSVGSEFFSQNSPSVVYSRALKRVKADPRVIEVLGEPISGHGAPSGRGRRRDVLHQEYIVDGEKYMRVQFYVDGSKRKGTVHVDLKKNEKGKYDCRFLFVELKGHPSATIILEDNR